MATAPPPRRIRATLALVACCGLILPHAADVAAGASQAQPIFQSGVDVVEVTALVYDDDGNFVGDLSRDEFIVLEEDEPQTLVAFERVLAPASAPVETESTGAAPVARDVATNNLPADGRIFVLVLDGLHVGAQRAGTVREYAQRFIQNHVGPSDLVAVIAPGGSDVPVQEFTNDKTRLLAAVERFSGQKLLSATIARKLDEELGGALLRDGRDPDDEERAYRVSALSDTLGSLARHLGAVERRRKALLLFSEGLDYNVADITGKVQRHAAEVVREMDRAIGSLARANVAVYTIDPRGLGSAEGELNEFNLYNDRPVTDLSEPGVQGEYIQAIRSLRRIAEQTGGFALVDRNDPGEGFARIVRESSNYYLLGYAPPDPGRPGEFRRIEVRTTRPGVKVVARTGYTRPERSEAPRRTAAPSVDLSLPSPGRPGGMSPASPASPTEAGPERVAGLSPELASLLESPLPRPGLPLRVQAIPFRDGGRARVALIIEVAGAGLALAERDGAFRERLEVALATVDEKGRAGNGTSAQLGLSLSPEQAAAVKATGVRWLTNLALPAGRHQIRVAARAQGSARGGMVTQDIVVPRFQGDTLSLSGVVLTSLPSMLMVTEGDAGFPVKLQTPPSAVRRFVAGDRVTAAAVVYVPEDAPGQVVFSARIERVSDGMGTEIVRQPLASETRNGEQSIGFSFGTGALVAGEYVLRVAARAEGDSKAVERLVPFVVVPGGRAGPP